MSVCSLYRRQGFQKLLQVDADPVSFRGAPLSAIVAHGTPGGANMQEAALGLLGGSSIEFLRTALTGAAPKLGEIFTAADGTTHRVIKVESTPTTWKLTCEPVDP